ncbi:MAG: phenylalanine and histidine ammonia-lyase [Rhodospirillaceae bacterium]|nr:phenylalanine and histidine ammonia-lyase [Rhodospirillaceae bacterium]
MTQKDILLGDGDTGIADVVAVARRGAIAVLSTDARNTMERSRAVVEAFSAEDRPVYGLTRGLGSRVVREVTPEERSDFSRVVVLARACGAGDPLSEGATRAAMVARASSMARGGAGVRPLLVDTFCAMLREGVHPYVPSIGSVGASDLALCANMALPLLGEGRAMFKGTWLEGKEAMERAGIDVVAPLEKEGLSLCSANSISVGLGSLVLHDLTELLELMDGIAVLTFEAFRANPSPIDPRVVMARGAPGQARAAQSLRHKLAGTALFDDGEPRRVQDPISIRCVSHVHGSLRAAIDFCEPNILVELNGAGDNPVVLEPDQDILSTGNFHTPAMAVAFDALALAIAQAATISAQRVGRMLQNLYTDLPDGLTNHGTTHAGMGLLSLTAETLSKDIHMLGAPASLQDSSTYNVEDHAPMATLAVRQASQAAALLRQLAACELLTAAQAFELRAPESAAHVAHALYSTVREIVPALDDDRSMTHEVASISDALADGRFRPCLDAAA